MKISSFSIYIIFIIFFLNFLSIKSNDYDDLENYDNYGYRENMNDLNLASISYELSYDNNSVVRVILKTYYELAQNVKFKAFLKTEDESHEHILQCTNEFIDSIMCITARNITIDTEKKYFFYYDKKKSGSEITFDGEDIFEDENKISLIFSPEIPEGQILYKDNRRFDVKTGYEMVSGGYLYITRKSRKILHKTKNGFNKNIQLNHFIPHCGLAGYRPPNTLIAFKEAIRR